MDRVKGGPMVFVEFLAVLRLDQWRLLCGMAVGRLIMSIYNRKISDVA